MALSLEQQDLSWLRKERLFFEAVADSRIGRPSAVLAGKSSQQGPLASGLWAMEVKQ